MTFLKNAITDKTKVLFVCSSFRVFVCFRIVCVFVCLLTLFHTQAIVVNCPHNPTGYLMDQGKFNEILNIAKQHNIFVFFDEGVSPAVSLWELFF